MIREWKRYRSESSVSEGKTAEGNITQLDVAWGGTGVKMRVTKGTEVDQDYALVHSVEQMVPSERLM